MKSNSGPANPADQSSSKKPSTTDTKNNKIVEAPVASKPAVRAARVNERRRGQRPGRSGRPIVKTLVACDSAMPTGIAHVSIRWFALTTRGVNSLE